MSRITGYGFSLNKARKLSDFADRLGTTTKPGSRIVSPQVLVQSGALLVQVWKPTDSPAIGDLLAANVDGVHPGRIRNYDGGDTIGQDVWVGFIDFEDLDAGVVTAEHGRHYVGIPSVNFTSEDVEKPSYLCCIGEQTFDALPPSSATVTKGTTASFTLCNRNRSGSSVTQSALAANNDIPGLPKHCFVTRLRGGLWIATPGECP